MGPATGKWRYCAGHIVGMFSYLGFAYTGTDLAYYHIYITIYILPSGSLMVFNGIYSYLMELYSDSMGYKWDIPSGDLT